MCSGVLPPLMLFLTFETLLISLMGKRLKSQMAYKVTGCYIITIIVAFRLKRVNEQLRKAPEIRGWPFTG